jgi:hypothetical protein
VFSALALGQAFAPEQSGCARLAELFQRAAHVVKQLVLVPLLGQALQLAVDGAQIPQEAVEPLATLSELRAKRLLVL